MGLLMGMGLFQLSYYVNVGDSLRSCRCATCGREYAPNPVIVACSVARMESAGAVSKEFSVPVAESRRSCVGATSQRYRGMRSKSPR
jgi:hypothetical protein